MTNRSLACAALLLVACYNPKIPSGTQLCSSTGTCASGFTCAYDNHCYTNGTAPAPNDLSMIVDLATPNDLDVCTPSSCTGATPVCDSTSGQCVACLMDSQCMNGQLCQNNQCVSGCSALHGCGDAGICDVDAGMCKVCKSDGDCTDPASSRCELSSGRCVACQPNPDNCAMNQFCVQTNGVWGCQMGCKADNDCMLPGADAGAPDGGTGFGKPACCNHVCVDESSDANNCSKCGMSCGMGNSCCSSTCVDTTKDVFNCGGCGTTCGGLNANWACTNSACSINSCNGTFRDCNMNPVDGCEVNIVSDANNCLGCGKVCAIPNAMAVCAQACTIGACSQGFADCNKLSNDGCEVNTANDVNNCGACGKGCGTPNNGVAACKAGVCVIGSCNPGYADCDGIPGNGCEVNLKADANNCSMCAMKCPPPMNGSAACVNSVCGVSACNAPFLTCGGAPCAINSSSDVNNCNQCGTKCAAEANGVAACKSGICGIGSCNAGFADCDNNSGNGCEANLTNDVNNCKSCGNKCPAVANGTSACAASVCGIGSCNMAYADCNKNPGDGCEIDLQTDGNNCGKCGMVCPMMQVCAAGVCAALPQCVNPVQINDATRNVGAAGGGACDSGIAVQWYQFVGATGTKLPTAVPAINLCGTQATGWLNGAYPSPGQGAVTLPVCYNWAGNQCQWTNNIQVVNCGNFYVFQLSPPPVCNLRYCGTN